MVPDPKWLEILKASGWQMGAIATAAALLIYGNAKNLLPIPPLEPWIIEAAVVTFLVCGSLALFSFGPPILRAAERGKANLEHRLAIRRKKREVEMYISHMTPKEREILSYLISQNQKMFTYTLDGGFASTLISRGIVVCALRPGQAYTTWQVPFEVPDYVWDVFMEHKAEFPYTPPKPGETKRHPWAISWMVR